MKKIAYCEEKINNVPPPPSAAGERQLYFVNKYDYS
jgi:hypothetical protein